METEPSPAIRLETLSKRAQSIYFDAAARAEEHRVSYIRWNFWSAWLGWGAAVATGVAGVGFIASARGGTWLAIVAGVLALIAAIATATNTRLEPQRKADDHKRASDAYVNLRKDAREFRETKIEFEPDTAYDDYTELAERMKKLQEEAPGIEEWARRKVKKQGGSDYFRFAGRRRSRDNRLTA